MLGRACALLASTILSILSPAHADDIHVAVAANFQATLKSLVRRFEQQTGDRLLISTGSTGKLYAQIRQGAPFEVFLAADVKRPALLEQQGFAIRGTRFTYALGKLVLWSRDSDKVDQNGQALRDGNILRLAIANPKTAPYGRAAQQTLNAMGLWHDWQARLVRGENVGQTMQFAVTGNVDAAFVALAQVPQSDGRPSGSVWIVPESDYQPIEQQAVLLRTEGSEKAARRFLQFLQSDDARKWIAREGYGVVAR